MKVSVQGLSRCVRWSAVASRQFCTAAETTRVSSKEKLVQTFNDGIRAGGVVPVFRKALLFPHRIAIQDDLGDYTYGGLYLAAHNLSETIATELRGERGATVAYLCGNDASHVITQWAIWMSGNIAVPLSSLHPPAMLQYFLEDSGASLVLGIEEHSAMLQPIAVQLKRPFILLTRGRRLMALVNQSQNANIPPVNDENVGRSELEYAESDAMLIYTSGTTSKPKGVVWTHSAWATQIAALHTAWAYSANDVVLHTLPLHHVHGQLNSLNASLAAGAKIRMLPAFVSHAVWVRLLGVGEKDSSRVSVFHGVPAMYTRLVSDFVSMFSQPRTAEYVRATLSQRLRLMCAGSAPLPKTLFEQWEEISGHRLLERYGMTEVGMALSNPYRPVEARLETTVGFPLPGIRARIAQPSAEAKGELEPLVTVSTPVARKEISLNKLDVSTAKDLFADQAQTEEVDSWKPPVIEKHVELAETEYQGELLLKGPGVFEKYWNRAPELVSKDFTKDGWFRTGDTAMFKDGRFTILGRTSVDIIKTGGYKVSALQVESTLLEHENITDAAVVGIADPSWGERVYAAVSVTDGSSLTLPALRDWAKSRLAPYQIPSALMVLKVLPRNQMGKLDKKELVKIINKDISDRT